MGYNGLMAETLNISLSPGQLAWIKSRKEQGGFASSSDVIRDLIRREQEKHWLVLQAQFKEMDKKDAGSGPEPVEEIMEIVGKVKRERRQRHEANRGS
jgi:antitoxin ParD1/3/4